MVTRALLVVVTVGLLAGCGGRDDETSVSSGTTESPVISTTTPAPALDGATTDPVVSKGTGTDVELLTDIRTARHLGYDRVVFEFRKGVPGYDVRYAERPMQADGSGDEVAVAGGAVLRVRMEPALDADLTQESAPRTYEGPTRFSPDTASVVELVRTGGFEGVLTWAVGVNGERPFRVTRLQDPARLVIDISAG
jgi:hypothetical protein